jgi:hypothetical protein
VLALAIVVTAVLVVVVVVVARSGGEETSVVPLAASVGSSSETSVLLPMGHLDDPADTFWELFIRPAGGSSWVLRTPPGVADNGGLVAALPPVGPLVTGFLPSFDLTFSPLAQSSDSGRTWSTGQLPQALAPVADGLAVAPGGGRLALVSGRTGRTVLSSTGSLSTWRPAASARTLGRTASGCKATAVTAVAFDASGRAQLGLACSAPGRIGVAASPVSGSSAPVWSEVGPALPAGPDGTATVIRLEGTSTGTRGLARVTAGARTGLVAFWNEGATPQWVESQTLPVPSGWRVQATATGGTGQPVTVLLASGHRRRVEQVDQGGRTWVALPAGPADAGAVSTIGGETDVLVSSGSRLAVWALPSGARSWVRTATVRVPIQYGSSG